jgi:hypothetical protein
MSARIHRQSAVAECPGYDYHLPAAARSRPLRLLSPIEQMFGYYEPK